MSAASYDDYSVTLKWTATGSELTHGTGRSLFTHYTVQTSNSCTSRPDFCQCLVVQTPMDNTSTRNKLNTSMNKVLRSSMLPCLGDWVAIGHTCIMQLMSQTSHYPNLVPFLLKLSFQNYWHCLKYCSAKHAQWATSQTFYGDST